MPGSYRLYKRSIGGDDVLVDTIPAGTTQVLVSGAGGEAAEYHTRAVSPRGVEDIEPRRRLWVRFDAAGALQAARPNRPADLRLEPLAGGGLRARWSYDPTRQATPPARFEVFAATPGPYGSVSFAGPAAAQVTARGAGVYYTDLGPFAGGQLTAVMVRAVAAAGAGGGGRDSEIVIRRAAASVPAAPTTVAISVSAGSGPGGGAGGGA